MNSSHTSPCHSQNLQVSQTLWDTLAFFLRNLLASWHWKTVTFETVIPVAGAGIARCPCFPCAVLVEMLSLSKASAPGNWMMFWMKLRELQQFATRMLLWTFSFSVFKKMVAPVRFPFFFQFSTQTPPKSKCFDPNAWGHQHRSP